MNHCVLHTTQHAWLAIRGFEVLVGSLDTTDQQQGVTHWKFLCQTLPLTILTDLHQDRDVSLIINVPLYNKKLLVIQSVLLTWFLNPNFNQILLSFLNPSRSYFPHHALHLVCCMFVIFLFWVAFVMSHVFCTLIGWSISPTSDLPTYLQLTPSKYLAC